MTRLHATFVLSLSAVLAVLAAWLFLAGDAGAGPRPTLQNPGSAVLEAARSEQLRVALTFDDLPLTGNPRCDPDLARRVTADLTGLLRARSIPAAGLATPGQDCLTPELLAETYGQWRDLGAVLGNHTATHPDLNRTPVAAYLADLDRGQALLEAALGAPQEERWFRPPMLHSGDTAAKKRALTEHLEAEGYRLAPVTVDNQEWVYAAVYTDARQRGDRALAERVAAAYLDHLEENFAFYEDLSQRLFGRQVPQVLLLHANLLNAERLGEVVTMLEGRGYSFVGLREAVADPAYDRPDPYVGERGLSWLQRWAMAEGVEVGDEPREAAWVAEARRRIGQVDGGSAGTGARPSDHAAEAEAARAAILTASAAFSRAYVDGDMADLAAVYTKDAVLLPPELPAGEVLRGPEAAADYFRPRPRRRNISHAMRPDELVIQGTAPGDLAVDTGVWSNEWQAGDAEPRHAEGRYLVVWRRGEDGDWRIAYDMWHRPPG